MLILTLLKLHWIEFIERPPLKKQANQMLWISNGGKMHETPIFGDHPIMLSVYGCWEMAGAVIKFALDEQTNHCDLVGTLMRYRFVQ